MSDILFSLIKEEVYKDKEIQEISLNSQGKAMKWIFDFKGQGLSKVFLEEYSKVFWKNFESSEYNNIQVGGMETGAIPLIVGVSLFAPSYKKVNSFYIRKSRKKSDLANLIEGDVEKDKPIILVDDIINNGDTIKKQIKILEEKGLVVSAVFVCLRYRDILFYQELTNKGIKIFSIFELNDFSSVLPVRNIEENLPLPIVEKYKNEYKLTLTNKPNLYLVVPKSAPLLVGDFIYMGCDDGNFFCINTVNGEIVWSYKVIFGAEGKRIFSSPAVYKDFVVFGAYDGNLYCLNRHTGKREWVFSDGDWIGSSPAINIRKGVVYIGLEFGLFSKCGGIAAVDVATGKLLWGYYEMKGLTHASPAYNQKHNIVVCGCNDMCIYAFNLTSGKLLWKFETKGEIKYGAIFDDSRNVVIFGSLDGGVYVLNLKDGTLYHKFEALYGFYSNPVMYRDSIIIGSLDKKVYCFNLAKKKTEWVFETAGRIFSSPVLDNDEVFIGSNDGRLYELDVKTGTIRNTIQLSERIVNAIQINRFNKKRVLYIPTHKGELYKMREI